MSSRGRASRIRGTGTAIIMAVVGCILLGVGIANERQAREIAEHGVAVTAAVTKNHGVNGQDSVMVRYRTAGGQREQGILDTPDVGTSYAVGTPLAVVYDPDNPGVVAFPGSGTGGGWAQIVVGAIFLALLLSVAGWGLLRARRQGGRPAPSQGLG